MKNTFKTNHHNQKIRLRGLWRFYLSGIRSGSSTKENITQTRVFVKTLECGGNGNCTRRTVVDEPGPPLRYPHITSSIYQIKTKVALEKITPAKDRGKFVKQSITQTINKSRITNKK